MNLKTKFDLHLHTLKTMISYCIVYDSDVYVSIIVRPYYATNLLATFWSCRGYTHEYCLLGVAYG